MLRWLEYLQIGGKVFAGITLLLAGQQSTFSFNYKGKTYHLFMQLTPAQVAEFLGAPKTFK